MEGDSYRDTNTEGSEIFLDSLGLMKEEGKGGMKSVNIRITLIL